MKNLVKKCLDYLAASIAKYIVGQMNQLKYQDEQAAIIASHVVGHLNQKKTSNPIYFLTGPKQTPVIFVHNSYGQRVFLDPADYHISTHYLEILDWEEHLEEVYRKSFADGGVYLDIGGNVGLHVLRAARLGATGIYAFEPIPNTFDILSINMTVNGLQSSIFNYAIGEKDGAIGINVLDYTPSMARVEEKGEGLLNVPVKTLNTFAQENQEVLSQKLSLIKIDVEGHEGEIINGALEFLKQYSDFNIIMEFGSPSSIRAVQLLNQNFTFSMKLYRWMKEPISVDMSFVTDEKVLGGDLVLFGLRSRV